MSVHSNVSSLLEEDRGKKRLELLSKVQQLKQEELMDSFAFFLGNDPIKKTDLTLYQATKPFVFVGTSIFGSIALACHLGEKVSTAPQVIIVDFSDQVAKSWEFVKIFFDRNTEKDGTKFVRDFIKSFKKKGVVKISIDVYDDDSLDDLSKKLLELIDQYGLSRVKQLVDEAVILKQSWGHEDTFRSIRAVYGDTDIYAYPSNIVHSIKALSTQKKVAECVSILRPVLSIQTNLDHGEPTRFHLIQNNTVSSIMTTLGPGPFLDTDDKRKFNSEYVLKEVSSSPDAFFSSSSTIKEDGNVSTNQDQLKPN